MADRSSATWWLYMIECRGGGIYTGIAIDVDKRYGRHAVGKGARYTMINPPVRLLFRQEFQDRRSAAQAEYAIKRMSADQKWRLATHDGIYIGSDSTAVEETTE